MADACGDPDIDLAQIDVDLIEDAWPHLEPLYRRAIEAVSTDWTTDKIRAEAEARRLMLWAICDRDKPLPFLAAFASSVRTVRGEEIAILDHCAGHDLQRWLVPMLAQFEAIARSKGITRIEAEGRPGWARALPGFRTVRIILEKVL